MRTHRQVAPYFPEPIVVSRNIGDSPYALVVSFSKQVISLNLVSSLLIGAFALWPILKIDLPILWGIFLGSLVLLTIVRRVLNGGVTDNILSALFLLPTLVSAGEILRIYHDLHFPVVFLAAIPVWSAIYALFCGRDLSFPGFFVLSSLATILAGVVSTVFGLVSWSFAMAGSGLAIAGLAYFTYDLASILRRRRPGEEVAAAADIFRDLLNFLTYSVRVILHWRKFRFI